MEFDLGNFAPCKTIIMGKIAPDLSACETMPGPGRGEGSDAPICLNGG